MAGMRFEEKLRKQMLLRGFNQQRLARESAVSDSEISRILSGKSSNPGLENAFKLAKAVGLPLDFLADDAVEAPPETFGEVGLVRDGVESEVLDLARGLGVRQARRVLETVAELGYEVAIRRLLEMRPLIEVGDPPRTSAATPAAPLDRRASSA